MSESPIPERSKHVQLLRKHQTLSVSIYHCSLSSTNCVSPIPWWLGSLIDTPGGKSTHPCLGTPVSPSSRSSSFPRQQLPHVLRRQFYTPRLIGSSFHLYLYYHVLLLFYFLLQATVEQGPRCHETCRKHQISASQMVKKNKITRDVMKIWDCEINCPIWECITRFKEPDMQDYMFDISFIYQDNSYFLLHVNAVEMANAKIKEVKESGGLQKCGHSSETGKKIPQSMYRPFPKYRQCKVPCQRKI